MLQDMSLEVTAPRVSGFFLEICLQPRNLPENGAYKRGEDRKTKSSDVEGHGVPTFPCKVSATYTLQDYTLQLSLFQVAQAGPQVQESRNRCSALVVSARGALIKLSQTCRISSSWRLNL